MDLFAFIHASDPIKVRVVKREREVDEPRLLDTTVGRIASLLLVALDCADIELSASVERLFDEAPVRLRHQGKRKSVAVDAGGASHPPKKIREDHETPSGTSVAASVSTMPEREDEDHTDYVAEPNLCTIRAPSSNPVMTNATTVTSMVDSTLVSKERTVKPSLFAADSSSAVYVPQWSITNGSCLDDGSVCRVMVDEFAPPKFFASVRGMEHDQLFIEFNVGVSRQMSLSAEVRMHVEYNVKERRRLQSVVKKQDELLKAKDGEIENLKAHYLNALKGHNIILEKERDALDMKVTDLEVLVVHKLEVSSAELQEKITVYDNYMEQLEKFQDGRIKVVNDKLAKLDLDLAEMACHLEEKFYTHLLNTISGWRWLLTHGLKVFLVKRQNSSEYLTDLGAAISRAIEKEMQSGLAADNDHGREGRSLADVAAYNPDVKVDFNTTLQELREVDFLLLAKLKSYKDASTEDIMNVLHLEGALTNARGKNDLQLDTEQLKVPIYKSEDQVTPLSKPLSVTSLMGTEGTSNVMPTTVDTTTTMSTTLASASTIAPISIDDYEVMGTNDQTSADGNTEPFLKVDDAKLNIPQ
uniref:Transposase (Putative), gypsy type n=1 Tax=Tanacetum cinerariifolium TaxID=118510 RepID=A0A699I4D8_TANCI|nr:hypothetical protein [Tanacetum cinerariifolium]